MKTKNPKKKNPADLTLRNLRAMKKKLDRIAWSVDKLLQWIDGLTLDVHKLDLRVKKIEGKKK